MPVHHAIIPGLQYDDAPAAIGWLEHAFGFTRQLVVPNDDGGIAHAQLLLDGNMIMLGSVRPGPDVYGRKIPAQAGGVTMTISVTLDDPDAHYAVAAAAGAEIITPVEDMEYGGRSYCARDCGGHVWTFGSYDPWA